MCFEGVWVRGRTGRQGAERGVPPECSLTCYGSLSSSPSPLHHYYCVVFHSSVREALTPAHLAAPHLCTRRTLRGHEGPIRSCCLLPTGIPVSGGEDGSVRLWDAGSGAPIVALEAGHPVNALQAHAASGGLWEPGRRVGRWKDVKVSSLAWHGAAVRLSLGWRRVIWSLPCRAMQPANVCLGAWPAVAAEDSVGVLEASLTYALHFSCRNPPWLPNASNPSVMQCATHLLTYSD